MLGAGSTALVRRADSEVVPKAWPAQSATAANLEQAFALTAVMRDRGEQRALAPPAVSPPVSTFLSRRRSVS